MNSKTKKLNGQLWVGVLGVGVGVGGQISVREDRVNNDDTQGSGSWAGTDSRTMWVSPKMCLVRLAITILG